MCAASENSARECATIAATTSAHMKATIRPSAIAMCFASAPDPWPWPSPWPCACPWPIGAKATPRSGGHPGELATGHVQHLAVHVVGPRRAEEEHAAGGLLGRPRPPERDQHRGHPAQLVRDAELDLLAADLHRVRLFLGGGQTRLDVAERDGVHVDLELAPFLGHGLSQAYDGRLARRVV